MISDIKIIQYLPLTHPRATLRFMKRLNAAGVMSILDLEDSAQDPFDAGITRDLKINARNNFLDLVNSKAWIEGEFEHPIYVRVNSSSTEFYHADIQAVLDIHEAGFPVAGVFLPMVESYDEINEAYSMLARNKTASTNHAPIEIIPMIETAAGMHALQEILERDKSKEKFSKVHYGHFDYCLDADLWPFPDPDQDLFWRLIEPIAKLILAHNKTYIHTPFPFMNDIELFWSASRHLMSLFPGEEVWSCSLNSEISLSDEPLDNSLLTISPSDSSLKFKVQEAQNIQEQFLAGRANRRSFGVSSSRFIPPHQYFAAAKFLDSIKEDEI